MGFLLFIFIYSQTFLAKVDLNWFIEYLDKLILVACPDAFLLSVKILASFLGADVVLTLPAPPDAPMPATELVLVAVSGMLAAFAAAAAGLLITELP